MIKNEYPSECDNEFCDSNDDSYLFDSYGITKSKDNHYHIKKYQNFILYFLNKKVIINTLYRCRFFRNLFYKSSIAEILWLDYYDNLYITRKPDKKKYNKLLKLCGVWNCTNPYKEGNEYYYHYHQNGIFLKEIDFLLDRWRNKYIYFAGSEKTNKSSYTKNQNYVGNKDSKNDIDSLIRKKVSRITKKWKNLYKYRLHDYPNFSIQMSEKLNHNQWIIEQDEWEMEAIHCLILLFKDDPKMWSWIKTTIHYHNIVILYKILLSHADKKDCLKLKEIFVKQKWIKSDNN